MKFRPILQVLQEIYVPECTKPLILTVCPYCHYELYINDNLTELRCLNPQCEGHMSAKLEAMCKQFNIEQMGRANCLDIIRQNHLKHHMQLFTLTKEDMPNRFTARVKESLWLGIQKNKRQTLGDIVKACKFKGFSNRAVDLFAGYNSIDDFYRDFNYNPRFLARKLNMTVTCKTILNIYRILIENRSLLKTVSSFFEIEKTVSKQLKVAITGSVKTVKTPDGKTFRPRESYVAFLKEKYKNEVNVVMQSSVTDKCHVLLCDTEEHRGKYAKAQELGIPILTCKEIDNLDVINRLISEK